MSLVPPGYAARSFCSWTASLVFLGLLAIQAVLLFLFLRARRSAPAKAEVAVLPAPGRVQLESEQLCSFIRETTKLDPHRKPGQQLANLIQSIFRVESVAVFDADLVEVYSVGDWSSDLKDSLQNICIFETVSDDLETGLTRRVVRMGNLPIGSMLLRGETRDQMASTIASVVAITFDRYHALANESRTESARQTEQLRTTVLDSLAHAYKTPLTAIAAASEGLSAMGSLSAAQAGLVSLIDEQTKLLNRLTTRLLKTARLQGSDMIPHAEKVAVAPLIEDVVASLRDQLANMSVRVAISRDDLSLCCDRSLLVALLTQYVDNAAKYGASGTMVTIRAAEHSTEVTFSVHSYGPAIPAADFERIFDRYYRSSFPANKVPGTGIGLPRPKAATSGLPATKLREQRSTHRYLPFLHRHLYNEAFVHDRCNILSFYSRTPG
jgi:two-component system sensor histidine kinase KdpD